MFTKTLLAAAALASASARESELFLIDQALEEYEMELSDKKVKVPATSFPTEARIGDMTDLRKGSGCLFNSPNTTQIFGMKGIDLAGHRSNETDDKILSSKPWTLVSKDNSTYMGSICSVANWDLIKSSQAKDDRFLQSPQCGNVTKAQQIIGVNATEVDKNFDKSTAKNYKCAYTFGEGVIYASNLNATSQKYEGYKLVYESQQMCNGTNEPYRLIFDVKCDAEKDLKLKQGLSRGNGCSTTYSGSGKAGCATIDYGPLLKFSKVLGAFMIVAGLAICFFGIKIYEYIIFFFAFLAVASVIMSIGFQFYSGPATPLIISAVIAVIAGAAIAYYFKELIKKHGIPLLGFLCGGIIGFMLINSFPVHDAIKAVVGLALAGLGAYVGYAYNEFIKVAGMAIIGSGLFITGVGQYAPKFPSMVQIQGAEEVDAFFVAYIAAFILFAVGGYFVQAKLHVSNDEGSNAFTSDD